MGGDAMMLRQPTPRWEWEALWAYIETEGLTNGCKPGTRRFLRYLVEHASRLDSAKQLAAELRCPPTSIQTRLARAGLPSPTALIDHVRWIRAAQLFSPPREVSVQDVAFTIGFATHQSFARHIRIFFGITPSEFRARKSVTLLSDQLVAGMRRDAEKWRQVDVLAPGLETAEKNRVALLRQELARIEASAMILRAQLQEATAA